MLETEISRDIPVSLNLRPPALERRNLARRMDDPFSLVALTSDESYFVQREALGNPNTPVWIVDLLVRAGAPPDLRSRGEYDT
jgi:hypothetical protein